MAVKSSHKKIVTQEEGITAIFGDDQLIGIIYNDTKLRVKRCYFVEEMGVEDIASLMERDETVVG